MKVSIEKVLVLEFELPGVKVESRGGSGGSQQLEHFGGEWWRVRVKPETIRSTAQALRQVADELDSVASRAWKLDPPVEADETAGR